MVRQFFFLTLAEKHIIVGYGVDKENELLIMMK